jgi:single-stranded DNA-binding protein
MTGSDINRVLLTGTIGEYGVILRYTEKAKPFGSFSVGVWEVGTDEAMHPTFCEVRVVGRQAEPLSISLEVGDRVLIDGKLQWRAGRSKDLGKHIITVFDVPVLSHGEPALASVAQEQSLGVGEGVHQGDDVASAPEPTVRKPRDKKWKPESVASN